MGDVFWPDPNEEPSKPVPQDHPRFVIDCVGWHTRRQGNEEMGDVYRRIYGVLIHFLQDNGLTTRRILDPDAFVADDTAIRNEDLTPEGDLLIRRAYSRWLDRLETGMDPANTTILERALKKIRTSKTNE